MHKYNPPKVKKPIRSDDLSKNLCPKDYNFVKDYNVGSIKPLVDAASFLDMKSLYNVCICRVATYFYIEPSMEGIEASKKRFNITKDITEEEVA